MIESADSTTNTAANSLRIGLWVRAFTVTCVFGEVRRVKMSKLIVVPLTRFVSDRKVTLQTLCTYIMTDTYEHYFWNGAMK